LAAATLRAFITEEAATFPALGWVWEALVARGKLLAGRGGFCWGMTPSLVCEAAGGDPTRAVPAGVALECLIAAVDILDDIEDDDAPDALWRRCGLPTAANIATLLLFLAPRATSRLARHGLPPATVDEVAQVFARAGVLACTGQQHDLDPDGGRALDEEAYLAVCELKAGALVEAGCRAGALVAGAAPAVVEAFGAFGRQLGVAMQVGNDLIAIDGEQAARGDLAAAKRTLPLVFALGYGPESARREIAALVARIDRGQAAAEEASRLRRLILDCGGVEYSRLAADIAWERAVAALEPAVGSERARRLIDAMQAA
jgi:geranylgeranyl diphosphate synthase type I